MIRHRIAIALILALPAAASAQPEIKPTIDVRHKVQTEIERLRKAIDATLGASNNNADLVADVSVYYKAASFLDRLDEYAGAGDVDTVLDQVATGLSRAKSLADGQSPWAKVAGSVIRGYRSAVDGSVQPYAIEIPTSLDPTKPARLDVILHGRNAGLNESRFIQAHEGKSVPNDRPGLTLHVFGRTNNAYRWAGETDVFEAIKAVKRNYKVDDDRIVLRGFSMGGAGAWHIGLHYPSLWTSIEPGAGFTDTWKHAKLDPQKLPPWRVKAATIYDSADVALNAFNVPVMTYGGENDPQLQASTNIIDALKGLGVAFKTDGLITTAEGLDFRRVVGKGMGHKVDPASEVILKKFRNDHASRGLDRTPKKIRFITYTLAYNTAAWLSVERMAEHYTPATVEAELGNEVATVRTKGVAVLAIDRRVAEDVTLDGKSLPLRLAAKGLLPNVYYRKGPDGWEVIEHEPSFVLLESLDGFKSPAVHGPIDDAFRGSFLVVTPTGKPWNPEVDAWAKSARESFEIDWLKWFRGDVRTKRDVDITESDVAENHLILFGDPGSNILLSRILPGLPLTWTREKFRLGAEYDAAKHVPVLIAPNPLNPKRYVVVNSGQTFQPSDFKGTNALLFPRLGDYGVIRLEGPDKDGSVVTSGYFNERWRLP
jgi:hypothetical protein